MNILVINSGSSSIKFQLLDMRTKEALAKGVLERVGMEDGIFSYQPLGKDKIKEEMSIPDHRVGLKKVLDTLIDEKVGIINSIDEIEAVGHRIVHGGDKIKSSVILDDEKIALVEACNDLAPLHNPPNLMGVYAMKELLPNVIHVGGFDTAFHSTMPPESYIYAIPYEMYEKHGIRRFGFHGTSHKYVALRAAEILGIDIESFNCVTVHLGNGSSLTAVKGGRSVDTTLGYGTMCGVPMGTRAGDIDPAIILHFIDELGMSTSEVKETIYKKSGAYGLSGISMDMRDVEDAAMNGHERAILTLDIMAHSIAKNIAALAANMDYINAVVFTAGVGENSDILRERIGKRLKVIGAEFDPSKNQFRGIERIFSTEDSQVVLMTVPTNEELMIAIDTERLYQEQR